MPYLPAYACTREEVAEALLPALRDPSTAVRNGAMRVLWQTQRGAERALAGRDLGDKPSAWRAWVEQALAQAEGIQPSPP